MTSISNMHRHHVQHSPLPMPAMVCEVFLTTAVVEHVEELDKSWSFLSWV